MLFNCGRQARPNLQRCSSRSRGPLVATRMLSWHRHPPHTPSPPRAPNSMPPLLGDAVDSKAREGWREKPTNDVSCSPVKGGRAACRDQAISPGTCRGWLTETRPWMRGPFLCVFAAFAGKGHIKWRSVFGQPSVISSCRAGPH